MTKMHKTYVLAQNKQGATVKIYSYAKTRGAETLTSFWKELLSVISFCAQYTTSVLPLKILVSQKETFFFLQDKSSKGVSI